MINRLKAVWPWMGNVVETVYTVAYGMWVTLRTWIKTYRPERKAFTEHFEYPELPVPVAARYRGFHRFDLTTSNGLAIGDERKGLQHGSRIAGRPLLP